MQSHISVSFLLGHLFLSTQIHICSTHCLYQYLILQDKPFYPNRFVLIKVKAQHISLFQILTAFQQCLPQKNSYPQENPPQYPTDCSSYVRPLAAAFSEYFSHHIHRQVLLIEMLEQSFFLYNTPAAVKENQETPDCQMRCTTGLEVHLHMSLRYSNNFSTALHK